MKFILIIGGYSTEWCQKHRKWFKRKFTSVLARRSTCIREVIKWRWRFHNWGKCTSYLSYHFLTDYQLRKQLQSTGSKKRPQVSERQHETSDSYSGDSDTSDEEASEVEEFQRRKRVTILIEHVIPLIRKYFIIPFVLNSIKCVESRIAKIDTFERE